MICYIHFSTHTKVGFIFGLTCYYANLFRTLNLVQYVIQIGQLVSIYNDSTLLS